LAYVRGEGVPQDYVQAHFWFNLAASGTFAEKSRLANDPQTSAATAREEVASKMTLAQIAEAQRMVREWKPRW